MAERSQTLCWDCANACGGCSWTDHWLHNPVEGWTAVRNDIRTKAGDAVESYIVMDCPEFIRDAYGGGQERRRK